MVSGGNRPFLSRFDVCEIAWARGFRASATADIPSSTSRRAGEVPSLRGTSCSPARDERTHRIHVLPLRDQRTSRTPQNSVGVRSEREKISGYKESYR